MVGVLGAMPASAIELGGGDVPVLVGPDGAPPAPEAVPLDPDGRVGVVAGGLVVAPLLPALAP